MSCLVRLSFVCVAGILTAWLPPSAAAAQPIVVLSSKSVDELLDRLDVMSEASGAPGLRVAAEFGLGAITKGEGLSGIDRTEPFGAYWTMNESKAEDRGTLVGFIPVSNTSSLKRLVKKLVTDFKESSGLWSMTFNGQSIFAKVKDGYCFMSPRSDAFENLADPKTILSQTHDISIDLRLEEVSDEHRRATMNAFELGFRASLKNRHPLATETGKRLQQQLDDLLLKANDAVVFGSNHLSLGISVNPTTQTISCDATIQSKPASTLGQALIAYAEMKPKYAAIPDENTQFSLICSVPTTGIQGLCDDLNTYLREFIDKEIDEAQINRDNDHQAKSHELARRFADAVISPIRSGAVHYALLIEPSDDDTLRMIIGQSLANGAAAEKLLDDLQQHEQEELLTLDADKYAGARIHALAPTETVPKAIEYFGDSPGHIAIHADNIWFAAGAGNLKTLKQAIDKSSQTVEKPVAPVRLWAKPASLLQLYEVTDPELAARVAEGAGKPNDLFLFEVVADEPAGLRLHLETGFTLFGFQAVAGDK